MRISFSLSLLLLAIVGASAGARAETELTFGGQVRVRQQIDAKRFEPDSKALSYAEMRSRADIAATIDSNTLVFVQIQDSRNLGGRNWLGERTSGTLYDGKNVDVHQAYVQVDNIFGKGFGGLAGRFEFNQGNQRVFGSVGWNNVGRSWEGSNFWLDRPVFKVSVFDFKAYESLVRDGPDFDIVGVYSTLENVRVDLFAFYEHDRAATAPGIARLKRGNVGTYFYRRKGAFDFEANGVYQFGKKAGLHDNGTVVQTVELDVSAFMFTAEVGRDWTGDVPVRVSAGVDYSSGDAESNDLNFHTYENSYYTGHKFRGHMDYFVESSAVGLVDLLARAAVEPIDGWHLRGDFHYFSTPKKFRSVVDSLLHRSIGGEIDLAVSTTRVAGTVLEAGASVFFPTKAAAEIRDTAIEPDPGYWLYSMVTADF